MKDILKFLIEIGKLKSMPRRGWVINQIKNPESIADHTFRTALMAWVLSEKLGERKKKLNFERLLKIALIHDLCEVYAGDATPYDSILPRNKKALKELMKTWPRFSNTKRRKIALEKNCRETKSLEKLISKLPPNLKKEIQALWADFKKGLSLESRLFRQTDKLENFLQAMEYWKKYKKPPQKPWWDWAREFFDNSLSLEFIDTMDKEFHKHKKPRV